MEMLSNLLLSQIISEIDSNVDLICLLLTCKRLYSNSSSLRDTIKFKEIRAITDKGHLSERFAATVNRFNLKAFKQVFENSVSDHFVSVDDDSMVASQLLSSWISTRLTQKNASVKAALLVVGEPCVEELIGARLDDYINQRTSSLKSLGHLDLPTTKELYIKYLNNLVLDLESVDLSPTVEHLSVFAYNVKIGSHQHVKTLTLNLTTPLQIPLCELGLDRLSSLTTLSLKSDFVSKIKPGILPTSLTSLSLKARKIPSDDLFLPLKSLVHLKISYCCSMIMAEDSKEYCVNLESLGSLVSFKFYEDDLDVDDRTRIEVRPPPSLTNLCLLSPSVHIPSPRYSLPLLDRLSVPFGSLVGGKVSLLSSPLLKTLIMTDCDGIVPAGLIPQSVETVKICSGLQSNTLEPGSIPSSVTNLRLDLFHGSMTLLPESLTKLDMIRSMTEDTTTLTLPSQLQHIKWRSNWGARTLLLTLPTTYPVNLHTLNMLNLSGDYRVSVPPTITSLSIPLFEKESIEDRSDAITVFTIAKKINIINNLQQQQEWLPNSTTHLCCRLLKKRESTVNFRLDQVINQTNVKQLEFQLGGEIYNFSIKRLDQQNKSVLFVDSKSLYGGIITQRISSSSSMVDGQSFAPIYLYLSEYDPTRVGWGFEPLQ
ncbi:hypothetical protein DFA_08438 [Cavenderia fasciculata]|uniref:Uncharacterized protein n=1 Tax=Cavenderia fasciculata TaxID=261658 RepID=F4Q669_CACFS|nr:uncharacterized protein DFA_08438 [Cavenderia fasciculata]EGG17443.1 hypothetical protein DFA_08438 [Cavenderia fasciculata]|eukprot:XP_004355927.1 hypothetical protein DFA_08438 [Cavenderia fasciculata]